MWESNRDAPETVAQRDHGPPGGRVTGQLQWADGGGGDARCVTCGALAVGPCARCHVPVCGDCCVLTEGGARVWAICLRCERHGGRSLLRGWAQVGLWVGGPLLLLALAIALLEWLAG